jgi:hypothetical protein
MKTTNPEVSFFNPPLDKLKKTKTHLRADVGHTCMYSFYFSFFIGSSATAAWYKAHDGEGNERK